MWGSLEVAELMLKGKRKKIQTGDRKRHGMGPRGVRE